MVDDLDHVDLVIDASALMKLILEEPESPAFRAWYSAQIEAGSTSAAPGMLAYEMAHLIGKNLKPPSGARAKWLQERHAEVMSGIVLDHDAASRGLAWMPPLSGYDASYLATAAATGATLVSYDEALIKEARKSGIRTHTPR